MIIWTATNYYSRRSCIISTLKEPVPEIEEWNVWHENTDANAFMAGALKWLPLDLFGDAGEKLVDLTKLQDHEPPSYGTIPNCFGLIAPYDEKFKRRIETAFLSADLKQLFIRDSKIN